MTALAHTLESVFRRSPKEAFCEFLAHSWKDSFVHSYSIEDSHQRFWRHWTKSNGDNRRWHCKSMADAEANYSWAGNSDDFSNLSLRLREAMNKGSESIVLASCLEIFKWGGVARTHNDLSKAWVNEQAAKKTLSLSLRSAVDVLSPKAEFSFEPFETGKLPMNSAMTKVYAAADYGERVVIYDGRVGAALGLLVRRLLEMVNESTVPCELAFRWGDSVTNIGSRNPSSEIYLFSKLPTRSTSSKSDLIRARLSKNLNEIIADTISILHRDRISVTPQQIERALFMIGYDVKGNQ
jgi:hypothetical protein